jgi:hypothetical protein
VAARRRQRGSYRFLTISRSAASASESDEQRDPRLPATSFRDGPIWVESLHRLSFAPVTLFVVRDDEETITRHQRADAALVLGGIEVGDLVSPYTDR